MEEDFENNGLSLIQPITFTIFDIKKYIENSSSYRHDAVKLFSKKNGKKINLLKITEHFIIYFDEFLTNIQLAELCVIACLVYSCEPAVQNAIPRNNLLSKAFSRELYKSQIDLIVKYIFDVFKRRNNIKFALNILKFCNHSKVLQGSGPIIGNTLAYALICEISESKFDANKSREFSNIIQMIYMIDADKLRLESSILIINILVRTIGFLVNALKIPNFHGENGIRQFFKYTLNDLISLKIWFEDLFSILTKNRNGKYWDLRMNIIEYITICIMDELTLKIKYMEEMQMDLLLLR